MNYSILSPDKDPMGRAIADYFETGKAGKLRVLSSMFDEDEIPVRQLFRSWKEMPVLERTALELSRGKILDVGAGSGCHALVLQEAGKEVTAIDISPLAVDVMQKRGLTACACDFFDERFAGPFDTILMLMNGSGIIGKAERLPGFFRRLKQLLAPGGCLLMDSSDLRYLYENEDGSLDIDLNAGYYGEVDFRMFYNKVQGEPFDWLYVDFETLGFYAAESGFHAEKIREGRHFDYLARITFI